MRPAFGGLSWLMSSLVLLQWDFFFNPEHHQGSTLTFPEGNLRDLWQHFRLHLPPLPFFSPSSPRPTLEGQEFLCSSDPAAVADCSQVTSVTFALLSPSRSDPAAPLSTTSLSSAQHRTLALSHLPSKCRPQRRASRATWIDMLSSTLPPPATSTEFMSPRILQK